MNLEVEHTTGRHFLFFCTSGTFIRQTSLIFQYCQFSLSLSLFVYFYPTSALVSQVAGEWTSVQAQIAKGDGERERVRIVEGAGEAKSFGLAYKFYL